ncbi:MAG TPA: amidase [Deltaproteobacteria bacterium]|nr:amidase [Deltaproteobacteria bacterium]HPR54173.1 amidase [Deltaproteobacteria bacterium]HXK45916.1 amidase [Deltaproteobacteria bacterium]
MYSDLHHRFTRNVFHSILILALFLITGTPLTAHADEPAGKVLDRRDLVFLPAHTIAGLIREGKITSSEVVEAYLEQIGKVNPRLNAIVTLDAEGARRRAREADAALKRGDLWGPLHGVPVTIKDNFATKGLKTTNSVPELAGYVPGFDATVVERIRKAGAVILGKTNLPPMAMDTQTNSPVFGITNNPWDLKRTPGGSSGGEAAAVAAGMTALGMGNDIGGSIRIPSHFCGIYGIKPTENFVSTQGISPGIQGAEFRAVRHMACCGPMARSVEDLRLGLTVIAGPDTKDPDVPWVDLQQPPARNIKDLRMAWTDGFGGVPVTAETMQALRAFTDKLAAQGCRMERMNEALFVSHMKAVSPEAQDLYGMKAEGHDTIGFKEAWTTYGKLMDMELGVYQPSFFRFISYVFGGSFRKDVPMLTMVYPFSYEKYLKVLTERDFFVSAMDAYLSDRDVLLCPVSCTAAYEHIAPWRYFGPYPAYKTQVMVDGKPVNYLVANMSYTSIFNLTGNPVVVIPIGYTKDGMPIGVQIVGRRWRDMELLSIAEQLDKVAAAYRRPQGD